VACSAPAGVARSASPMAMTSVLITTPSGD
jgi:hypothetical protein